MTHRYIALRERMHDPVGLLSLEGTSHVNNVSRSVWDAVYCRVKWGVVAAMSSKVIHRIKLVLGE